MIAELFTNNALNLVIIFGSCAALILDELLVSPRKS